MKISFIIPAYNEEKYLGECLESIIREMEGKNYDVEIIVVNNASTDNTKNIASTFSGVKVINEPTKGLMKARQTGLVVSTGELIAHVDSDARLTKGWLDIAMKEFSDNPKMVGLSGPFVFYDLSAFNNCLVKIYYYIAYITYIVNRFILRKGSMLQGGNFILRKGDLEKIGGYNLALEHCEDYDLARRMHKVGEVKFTLKFKMYSSARRLLKEGIIKMGIHYIVDYIWMMVFKKPYSKNYF